MMNREWVEKQAAKKAALAAAERAQAEQRAAMEAASAAGVAFKRGRGRPLGSKSKPRTDAALPPPENAQEAALRMLDTRKLSSKINYSVLADLFSDGGGPDGGPPPSSTGAMVSAAMREREESRRAADASRLAKQEEKLAEEQRRFGYGEPASGLADSASRAPVPRLGRAGLGSLRDSNWSSQLTSRGGAKRGKSVRFAEPAGE